jgi:NAD(P)-dependent dehydrogenase (short-subunit alcohol dehydrogenase family)
MKRRGSIVNPSPSTSCRGATPQEIQMNQEISTDKVAIVTGASQGIGAGIVQGLRGRGYRVIATSRSIKPSREEGIFNVAGDIADPHTAEHVIRTALESFGRIDTLVNNAGIFVAKPFTDYTADDFASVVGVNLAGFFRITQLAIEEMERRGEGHVVNITASLVDHPRSAVPALMAALTKGGLNAATTSLAIEYAARGIRVNAVAPGIIKTPMHPEDTHASLSNFHPVRRLGEIADIVDAVLFLDSATFVTGEILHVDGGESAGH